MRYTYRMVQLPGAVAVSAKETGSEAAAGLQELANRMAKDGWEFYRVDAVGIQVNPGCLGQLGGGKATVRTDLIATFRREAKRKSKRPDGADGTVRVGPDRVVG